MGKDKNDGNGMDAAPSHESGKSVEGSQRQKVREAFKIVESLDSYRKPVGESSGNATGNEKDTKKAKGSGLRLTFGLDAIVSESDISAVEDGSIMAGESRLINFHITIPYVWKIPVLGKRALGLVRRFQANGSRESIRDILKSLRAKSPL